MLSKTRYFQKYGKKISFLAMLTVMVVFSVAASGNSNIVWLTAGQGRTNWRYQPLETTISSQNVANPICI
jgi:hypothetical protein